MNFKTLLIYNSDNLFKILHEIRENFKFKVIEFHNKDIQSYKSHDYLIVSTKNIKEMNNCLILDDLPKKISFIIEKINQSFLKKIYANQSHLKIKKYILNLNSRKIFLENKSLKLTEKEIDLLLFLNFNNRSILKEIQKTVWKYASILETHTVETHIYRLRKKFLKNFNDNNFIKHDTEGYYLS
jgi:hypothetical protein